MAAEFFSKILPKVKAEEETEETQTEEPEEEELIDPQTTLREKCSETHHVKELAEKYHACNDRVNSRSQTAETCAEELYDMLHAIDHCVTPKLFHHLK